jgi:hypothetical protein
LVVVLHADQRQKPAQHHDGRATLDTRGRLRLTVLLTMLGLVPSDHSALALCNPAWLTVNAPLRYKLRREQCPNPSAQQ